MFSFPCRIVPCVQEQDEFTGVNCGRTCCMRTADTHVCQSVLQGKCASVCVCFFFNFVCVDVDVFF